MELHLQIKMNENLYLRDPEGTELGKKIIRKSVEMISKMGFEDFTFRKLAVQIKTTEAGIYRYFENKHRLLLYINAWYWNWIECQVYIHTRNMTNPQRKLETILQILVMDLDDELDTYPHIDKKHLHEIVLTESSKSYLTKHVNQDNKSQLFKPYKDLCALVAAVISEVDPGYKYPRSLASTLIEMSHFQVYFMEHLPSLTDFGDKRERKAVYQFLRKMALGVLGK